MITKLELAKNWFKRYTDYDIDQIGDYIILTNFNTYIKCFAEKNNIDVEFNGNVMPCCTSSNNITIINFGIGSSVAATIIDLLIARNPRAIIFLGKCGAIKSDLKIGEFILPLAAIRGDGTSNDYFPPEIPALPCMRIQQHLSNQIYKNNHSYSAGTIYTTNRRLWEWDDNFKSYLIKCGVIALEMELATLLMVSYANQLKLGALLSISDLPMSVEGIKGETTDNIERSLNIISTSVDIVSNTIYDIQKDEIYNNDLEYSELNRNLFINSKT